MEILINNSWAHRLTQSGLVQSVKVITAANGGILIPGNFARHGAVEMNLTDGELETIRENLTGLSFRLPRQETPIPKAAPPAPPPDTTGDDPVL